MKAYLSFIGATLFLLLSNVAPANAHTAEQTYVFLQVNDQNITGRFEMAVGDINLALGTDFDPDKRPTPMELEPHKATIEKYFREHVAFAMDGAPLSFETDDFETANANYINYVLIPFSFARFDTAPQSMEVRFDVLFDIKPSHRNLLVIEQNWATGTYMDEANIALSFAPSSATQTLDLTGGSPFQGFMGMVKLGTHHIWIGIDHILFLIALLLPSVLRREEGEWRWQPVEKFSTALIHLVKIVTVFTIAHTITLSLGVLGIVDMPSRLIESIIAISIAVAALDIVVPIFRKRIWWVIFIFGLFHGLGFASVLSDFGLPPNYLATSLIGFNLGVEIGQVVVVCLIFPFLYLVRDLALYRVVAIRAGAAALISVSLYWFIERGFLIDLPLGKVAQQALALVS